MNTEASQSLPQKENSWNPPEVDFKDMIKDSYRKARGGNAEMLTIYCSSCNTPVLYYQKDGQGNLFRCYLDRIFYPDEIASIGDTVSSTNDMPPLKCSKCDTLIGTPMIYQKERRLAFGLLNGRFYKRKGSKQ